jgi:hypothetical protein
LLAVTRDHNILFHQKPLHIKRTTFFGGLKMERAGAPSSYKSCALSAFQRCAESKCRAQHSVALSVPTSTRRGNAAPTWSSKSLDGEASKTVVQLLRAAGCTSVALTPKRHNAPFRCGFSPSLLLRFFSFPAPCVSTSYVFEPSDIFVFCFCPA